MMINFSKLSKTLICLFFPSRCAVCNKVIPIGCDYCDKCTIKLRKVPEYLLVMWSNGINYEMRYGSNSYFDGFAAPFFYEAGSRRVMLNFKFKGRSELSDLLSREMSQIVNNYYSDKSFDFICTVPTRLQNKLQRGYNQSDLLCRKIAKSLVIRHVNALTQIKRKKTQHSLHAKDRLKNVLGIYKANKNIDFKNKNILLVDDIITTGATVNECAKMLKNAGAKSVYCILATINN